MNTKGKQCFLQACMKHGSLECGEALKILATMSEKLDGEATTNMDGLRTLVEQLNRDLADYNQSLAFIKHTIVKKEFLVFTVTLETDISKRQSHLNDADRYVFTKLVEALAEEESFSISLGSANSILLDTSTSSQRPVQQRLHMHDLLDMWISQGYFLKIDKVLYVGPRLLVEFATYLKKNHPTFVKDCTLCHRLVLWVSYNLIE